MPNQVQFERTPENIALIKALGSKNKSVAQEAEYAFAAALGPIIQEVLQQLGTAGLVFTDVPFDADDSPSYPLDLYFDQQEQGYVTVWSQGMAGGLPTNTDVSILQELKLDTYRVDTAVSIRKKYARRARLDVFAKLIERMIQEVLVQQEHNAWSVVLKGLAEATTNTTRVFGTGIGNNTLGTTGSSLRHVIRSTNASTFLLHDLNALITRLKRVNSAWTGGTPTSRFSNGITDLFVSPEVMQDIRAFAYEPLNTASDARGAAAGDHAGIPLTDNLRNEIYNNGGMQSIYNVNLMDLNELGKGQAFNKIFDYFAGATTYSDVDGNNASAFTEASDEILVGVDNSKGAFIRPVALQDENGGQFSTEPDDQFTARDDKMGVFGFLEEGRALIDARAVAGIFLG